MSNNDKRILYRVSHAPEMPALNVGYGNFVAASRIIAILESGSLPVRRLREKAAAREQLLDATSGRKMRSILITDTNHIVVSALAPQTLQERLWGSPPPRINPAHLEMSQGEFIS